MKIAIYTRAGVYIGESWQRAKTKRGVRGWLVGVSLSRARSLTGQSTHIRTAGGIKVDFIGLPLEMTLDNDISGRAAGIYEPYVRVCIYMRYDCSYPDTARLDAK